MLYMYTLCTLYTHVQDTTVTMTGNPQMSSYHVCHNLRCKYSNGHISVNFGPIYMKLKLVISAFHEEKHIHIMSPKKRYSTVKT